MKSLYHSFTNTVKSLSSTSFYKNYQKLFYLALSVFFIFLFVKIINVYNIYQFSTYSKKFYNRSVDINVLIYNSYYTASCFYNI